MKPLGIPVWFFYIVCSDFKCNEVYVEKFLRWHQKFNSSNKNKESRETVLNGKKSVLYKTSDFMGELEISFIRTELKAFENWWKSAQW